MTAVFDAMQQHDIDALVLGREANARTVARTTRLWLAGTRAFAPSCVVVRSTGAVHVLANTDDAVPDGFPVERLYGITWNPEKLRATLQAIPGLADARRTGFDGMTPMMHALLRQVMPAAEFVDAGPLFTELSMTPNAERVAGVRAAAETARAGLDAMRAALRAGVRPRTLRGICAEAFASFGVSTPAFEGVATPINSPTTWVPPDRPLAAHEIVVLRAGALRDGWEASIARTFTIGHDGAFEQPAPGGWDALVAQCRPGTTVGAIRARGGVFYGVGHGVEPWPDDFVLVDGTTCALERADEHSLRHDVFCITADGAITA